MQTENGKIGLLLQPDCEFLFSYLTNLNFFSSGLSIEHILCMDYTEKTDTYCNIRNLSAILPLDVYKRQIPKRDSLYLTVLYP